ncbi:MAG: 16S rRNA (cytidine(1402)-2'-O)-methyltransferase [Patescibacteria group bacterium]|nr:16S rRNA (cytidine(1402)-2'-O)-methyltransferase [Patescibacteria group bacterium]
MASIYIVGTPIGNLEDLTFRAFNVLRKVDFVLAEDTRKTKILLDRYEISKPLISYYQHSKLSKIEYIIELLKSGKDLALVTDAGTPGISDPGNYLLEKIWEEKEKGLAVEIIPIPGASSLTSILSVCGFPTDDFLFLGFLPKKKGRQTLFEKIKNEKTTIIFFESPHRIGKTLVDLEKCLGNIEIAIGRELTKKFEEIIRGNISDVAKRITSKNQKGEFVVVLNNR